MQKFTDWLENEAVDCGMCDPPLEPQKALYFLKNYLLGEGWYITKPETIYQVNTAIVFEILSKNSSEFQKEWREYTQEEDCLRLKLKKSAKKIIKHIKYKVFKIKKNYIFKELRKMIPNLEVENLKQFAKWIVERDSTSVTFKCSRCGFEYTDADPYAQCEYKGCPMCLSVIEGTVERVGEYGEKL
ncbi:MAG: hypothetical protein J6A49_02705 [Clostridia bacterium]|nr:hypothetical protein [Clostridia bacterium]